MNEKVFEVDKDALKMALKGLARVGVQGSGAANGQRSCERAAELRVSLAERGQRSCERAAELRVYNLAH